MLCGGKQLVHGTCTGVGEDSRHSCWPSASHGRLMVEGWVQLLARNGPKAQTQCSEIHMVLVNHSSVGGQLYSTPEACSVCPETEPDHL